MVTKKPLTKIIQSGLKRRMTVAVAGAGGGARLITSHATSAFKNAEDKAAVRSQALAREAQLFTKKLGELKGAYVKIGQMMAMYGDHLLPSEVTTALRELENQTEPLHWAAIEPHLIETLGSRISEISIEKAPLAAASLSQVHRATRNSDGAELCLKVQYPGVARTISSDFDMVLKMLRLARWLPTGRDFEDWVQEIKGMLLDEVNYDREAQMTLRVAKLIAKDARFQVPTIEPRYSNESILAMEYLPGEAVTSPKVARLSQRRRNDLAYALLENFFSEVFEWGLMQTDPNYGNYRIQLRNGKDDIDKLNLLDFGAVRELPKSFQKALQKIILSSHKRDRQTVIEGAIELGCLQKHQSDKVQQSFANFCVLLMEPFCQLHEQTPDFALGKSGQYNWHSSRLLRRVGKAGAKAIVTEGFSSPPKEFALIARKLTGVFSFITALRAEFNAYPIIQKYL